MLFHNLLPAQAAPAAQYEDALVYEDALPPLQSTSPKFSPPPIQPEAQDSADALVTDISFEAADQKTPELVKDNSLRESSTAGRVSGRSPRDPKASRPSSSDSGEKRPMSGSKERPKSAGRIKSRPDWVDPLPQVPGQVSGIAMLESAGLGKLCKLLSISLDIGLKILICIRILLGMQQKLLLCSVAGCKCILLRRVLSCTSPVAWSFSLFSKFCQQF